MLVVAPPVQLTFLHARPTQPWLPPSPPSAPIDPPPSPVAPEPLPKADPLPELQAATMRATSNPLPHASRNIRRARDRKDQNRDSEKTGVMLLSIRRMAKPPRVPLQHPT